MRQINNPWKFVLLSLRPGVVGLHGPISVDYSECAAFDKRNAVGMNLLISCIGPNPRKQNPQTPKINNFAFNYFSICFFSFAHPWEEAPKQAQVSPFNGLVPSYLKMLLNGLVSLDPLRCLFKYLLDELKVLDKFRSITLRLSKNKKCLVKITHLSLLFILDKNKSNCEPTVSLLNIQTNVDRV